MKTNLDYFNYSIEHKEELIDPNYHRSVERIIIPLRKEEENNLTISNSKVIEYITTINTMTSELGYDINESLEVEKLIRLIIKELSTLGMNYSAFCQYFNVHNMNYSVFFKKSYEEKINIIKFILKHYLADRHQMYLSQGYSNIVMQVMCDNYSHKRKGSYGANKIALQLDSLGIKDLTKEENVDWNRNSYYLLADKNGKRIFKVFANKHGIKLTDDGRETEKYPDALIKIGDQYLIVEQKNMKEDGGGQDKQAREITNFVFRQPEFENLHYVTYVDGEYMNNLNESAHSKKLNQYHDIANALRVYESNYFVNQAGFEQLINDFNIENITNAIVV